LEQILQPTNHVQLKQSLYDHISLMSHAMYDLHVKNIIQLNLSHNSTLGTLKNTHMVNSKKMNLKDSDSPIRPSISNA
jgi:hypothetical protein